MMCRCIQIEYIHNDPEKNISNLMEYMFTRIVKNGLQEGHKGDIKYERDNLYRRVGEKVKEGILFTFELNEQKEDSNDNLKPIGNLGRSMSCPIREDKKK